MRCQLLLPLVLLVACGHRAAHAPASPATAPGAAARATIPATRAVCTSPESELEMPAGEVTTIDAGGVVRALAGHRGEMRRCYERYLKRDGRGGRVIATFAVRDDGTVAQIQMRGFAEPLDRCLCNVVARVQFPAPHATAIVSYPMQFARSL